MVKINCPVCGGYGRTPIRTKVAMGYYNPDNGESFPHESCKACDGTGFQSVSDEAYMRGKK